MVKGLIVNSVKKEASVSNDRFGLKKKKTDQSASLRKPVREESSLHVSVTIVGW